MNRIKHSRLKGIIYVLISIFLLFSIAMTGFRVYGLNQNMIDTQQIHDNLQKEKEELAKEVNNLSSKEYQVRYARENYEFKAEDETVIRLPK
ncbi:FtsB family cell division protein [Massilimicrobiota timonensis]|uniref:FtsB family cell division protein n=1 Tax=Massilimicrobiota timonensis TaxID=1776392 RepID=UPI00101CCF5F|nr:septum formation initiator family protein [Massilimicrobiota timonensis]